MRARTWAVFITVNVVVSAVVMLTVLFIWERTHTPAPTTPTSEAVSSATAPPVASPTVQPSPAGESSPGLVLYTVQEGDTLGAIAQAYGVSIEDLMDANGLTDPNVLRVGQTLVIPTGPQPTPTTVPSTNASPEPSPTAASHSTALPTLTPAGPSLIEISQVLGSGDLAAEVVIVRNRGGGTSLEGWTLSNAEGDTFTFPAITLFTNAQVRVHSAAGSSTPSDLYWGRATPAWTGGALITLRDAAGHVVDTYVAP